MPIVFSIKQALSKNRTATDKPPVRVTISDPETKTVGDLKSIFLAQIGKKINVNRIRFNYETSNEVFGPNEKAISTFNFKHEVSLTYKDLGPQISWKAVFVVEYFFPMIVFPLVWLAVRKFPHSAVTQALYPGTDPSATAQKTICWQDSLALMFSLHFVKRELETLYVHRFGHDTMPLSNIFKNSGYYWLFAFWIAHITLHPQYTVPTSCERKWAGVALFVVSEILNLKAHMDLRNLRPAGTRIRKVPRGILFSLVSCPNYLFEILSWVGFTLASQSVASAVFTVVGAAQMTLWAIQKHKRYRREFDGQDGREMYPKNRTILIPFLF